MNYRYFFAFSIVAVGILSSPAIFATQYYIQLSNLSKETVCLKPADGDGKTICADQCTSPRPTKIEAKNRYAAYAVSSKSGEQLCLLEYGKTATYHQGKGYCDSTPAPSSGKDSVVEQWDVQVYPPGGPKKMNCP